MPLYEYECPACENRKTALRSVAERDSRPPVCTHDDYLELVRLGLGRGTGEPVPQPMVRKVASTGGFVLKGKGWAKDGYGG